MSLGLLKALEALTSRVCFPCRTAAGSVPVLSWKSLITVCNITVDVAVLGTRSQNSVSQLPQEEASICPLATTHPSLKGPPLTAHQPQQSTNQSARPLTHSMVICALEESVPFVLVYSVLGKKKEKQDATTRGWQVKAYLHFYKT